MRMRGKLALLAAALTAFASVLVLAAPSSQAHPIMKVAFGSVAYDQCLWAPSSLNGAVYLDACSREPNTRAKWNLHIVRSNWEGSGNALWVLESVQHAGKCLTLPKEGPAFLGTCNWPTEENYNTFESFSAGYNVGGSPVYQLKSTTLWRQGITNRCLGGGDIAPVQTWNCNSSIGVTYWTRTAVS